MSKEQNLEATKRLGEAVSSGNLQALNEIFSADVIEHDPAPGQGRGPGGFIQLFTMMRTAFPDLKVTVDYIVQDENNLAMAYKIRGTHKGDFMGIAPTGKTFEARGMQIGRYENGKIVERWGSSDELGLIKQLGGSIDTGKGMLAKVADILGV